MIGSITRKVQKFTPIGLNKPFSIMLDLRSMRMDYDSPKLTLDNMNNDPFNEFTVWLEKSLEVETGIEPQAMCISTVNPETLRPSSRYVLLKEFTEQGFMFFTNFGSRKANEIDLNPQVAGVFYWPLQNRSVRFEGVASKVSDEISTEYFDSRPVGSRLSGIVSKQSTKITDQQKLQMNQDVIDLKSKFEEGDASAAVKPDYWGGYNINPDRFEFWQGQNSRFHDRFVYELNQDGSWNKNMLAP